MTGRTLIGGVVGGIVLFIWGSIAHVATPLGSAGIQSIPNEDAVMESMRANITQPGLYFFPGIDPARQNDEAAMKEWEAKAVRGPAGIMAYQLRGEAGLPPNLLITEFASNVLVGVLVAFILGNIAGSLAFRVVVAGAIALLAGVDIYGSYWNWYKFPTAYTLAQITIQVVGYLLMGAVIAAIARKR